MLKEYVLGTDGGTGQEVHAYRDKTIIVVMVNKRSCLIWFLNIAE